jgi:hypothetical protein
MPSSLRSRIIPPVTPSKLANAGVFTRWRRECRLSGANSWFTTDLTAGLRAKQAQTAETLAGSTGRLAGQELQS